MDEKKKQAVVGVLAAIIVGVGAFQFIGGGSGGAKKPALAPKTTTPIVAEEKKIPNPEFADKLPERDPFKASGDAAVAAPVVAPPKQQTLPQPRGLQGSLGPTEVLPNTGSKPLEVAPPAPVFNYRLAGLILGRHPAAVFMDTADKGGSQRLIPIGGSLDGDTQLISVNKGLAVVSFRGKKLRLTLGGTPDAN